MKYLPLIISTFLIILAFAFGILFEKQQHFGELEKMQNQKHYVNIEQLKTKLKFNTSSPNVIIQLNGEDMGEKKIIELIKE